MTSYLRVRHLKSGFNPQYRATDEAKHVKAKSTLRHHKLTSCRTSKTSGPQSLGDPRCLDPTEINSNYLGSKKRTLVQLPFFKIYTLTPLPRKGC